MNFCMRSVFHLFSPPRRCSLDNRIRLQHTAEKYWLIRICEMKHAANKSPLSLSVQATEYLVFLQIQKVLVVCLSPGGSVSVYPVIFFLRQISLFIVHEAALLMLRSVAKYRHAIYNKCAKTVTSFFIAILSIKAIRFVLSQRLWIVQ